MSEQSPKSTNKAQELLNSFDEEQVIFDEKQYWAAMNADAGTEDFSSEARQRLNDVTEYDAHLAKMAARDENFTPHDAAEGTRTNDFDPLLDEAHADNEAFDANLEAAREAKEAFALKVEQIIVGNKFLRYARQLARDVAAQKAYQPEEGDNFDVLADNIEAKQDHIESIVAKFLDSDEAKDLSTEEKDAIIDDIYDATEGKSIEYESTVKITPEEDPLDNETDDSDEETTSTTPESDPLDSETDDEEDSLDSETDDEEDSLDTEIDDDELDNETDDEEDPLDNETDDSDEETTSTTPEEEETESTPEVKRTIRKRLAVLFYRVKESTGNFIRSRTNGEHSKTNRNIAIGAVALATAGFAAWYFMGRHTGGVGSGVKDNTNTYTGGAGAGNGHSEVINPTHPSGAGSGEVVPTTPGTTGPKVTEVIKTPTKVAVTHEVFSPAAHTVTPGEGWFQTMKELNVPAGDRAALLEKVGPKLEKMGAAYRDASVGGWGINMPANGQFSDAVLKVIAEAK
ncbi:MAG: hypothetical protein ABIQ04_03305 [Candidatus Saccharimonadales bacterium]